MRIGAILLLVAGCSSAPYVPFDGGYDIHFILVPERPAKGEQAAGTTGGLEVRPVCTVSALVAKPPARTLPPAAEVALLRVPRGSHRIAVWDAINHAGGRATIDVERDLWVVMRVVPGDAASRLEVYDKPPRRKLEGGWQPLVAVPY